MRSRFPSHSSHSQPTHYHPMTQQLMPAAFSYPHLPTIEHTANLLTIHLVTGSFRPIHLTEGPRTGNLKGPSSSSLPPLAPTADTRSVLQSDVLLRPPSPIFHPAALQIPSLNNHTPLLLSTSTTIFSSRVRSPRYAITIAYKHEGLMN
jgi:hypothetical protein